VNVLQSYEAGSSWAGCQRQLDAWLAAFAAAYEAEQQLLGLNVTWPNIPAGKHIIAKAYVALVSTSLPIQQCQKLHQLRQHI
jgi:hypothetical protein